MEVEHEQDDHDAEQRQARLDQRRQAVLDELVERLDVVGQAADDHARAVARVEADRQRLQVREQLEPQVLQRPLSHPADQVGLRVGGDAVDHRRGEEHDDDQVERGRVVVVDALVDGELGQRRGRQRGGGGGDERHEHGQHAPAVGSQQLGQAAQLAPAPAGLLQAAAQLGAAAGHRAHRPVTSVGHSQARHLRLGGVAREEDLVREPLLDDLAVQLGLLAAARRGCRRRRSVRPRARRCGRPARSSRGGGRSRTSCAPASTPASARLISPSVEVSTDEVASSRMRIRGSARIARAMAIRWRWPPDRVRPRSPTRVS